LFKSKGGRKGGDQFRVCRSYCLLKGRKPFPEKKQRLLEKATASVGGGGEERETLMITVSFKLNVLVWEKGGKGPIHLGKKVIPWGRDQKGKKALREILTRVFCERVGSKGRASQLSLKEAPEGRGKVQLQSRVRSEINHVCCASHAGN